MVNLDLVFENQIKFKDDHSNVSVYKDAKAFMGISNVHSSNRCRWNSINIGILFIFNMVKKFDKARNWDVFLKKIFENYK